jgi:AcrR family transcriptional regulator
MAYSTVTEDDLLERTTALFLEHGFAGTSLSQIASATGLEKASLYYRYPGGKEEIALAVASRIGGWLEEFIVQPLDQEGDPDAQVREAARHLRRLYADGTKWCGLEMLSIQGAGEKMAAALKGALAAWVGAFAAVARRSGKTPAAARHRAELAVAQIEGALVLARVMQSPKVFQRVLEGLPAMLTGV